MGDRGREESEGGRRGREGEDRERERDGRRRELTSRVVVDERRRFGPPDIQEKATLVSSGPSWQTTPHREEKRMEREKEKNSHRINLPTDRIHPHRRKVSSIPGSFSELSFKDVPLVDSPVVRVGQVELDDSDEERSMVVGALSTDGVGSHEAPVVVA